MTTTFTERSLQEMKRAARRWPYWPIHYLGGSTRLFAFFLAAFAFAVRELFVGLAADPILLDEVEVGIFFLAAMATTLGLIAVYHRRVRRKQAAAQIPMALRLDSEGVTAFSVGVEPRVLPWSVFVSFRQLEHLVLLEHADKNKKWTAIPVDMLPHHERARLRATLLSHLRETS